MDIFLQILTNGIIQGSVIALIALGLSLIYGVLKFMNFAHGEMAMLGAFFYYVFFINLSWPIIPSFIAALALCGLAGILFDKLIFQPLKNESPWTLLITSIGVAIFLKSLVLLIATGKSKNYAREGFETTSYHLLNDQIIITDYQIAILLSTIIILISLALFLKYSKTGKAIRAVSDSASVAAILGINVRKTIRNIFIISTVIAGIAGILIGYEQNLSPYMGLWLSILAFSAVILGGLGNIWGAVAGAMILGILQNLIVGLTWWGYSIPTSYKSAIAFGIMILVLLIRPSGLFGSNQTESSRK